MAKHFLFFSGKLDKWEWDSGARDMSPVPKNKLNKHLEDEFKVSDYFYKVPKLNLWGHDPTC